VCSCAREGTAASPCPTCHRATLPQRARRILGYRSASGGRAPLPKDLTSLTRGVDSRATESWRPWGAAWGHSVSTGAAIGESGVPVRTEAVGQSPPHTASRRSGSTPSPTTLGPRAARQTPSPRADDRSRPSLDRSSIERARTEYGSALGRSWGNDASPTPGTAAPVRVYDESDVTVAIVPRAPQTARPRMLDRCRFGGVRRSKRFPSSRRN